MLIPLVDMMDEHSLDGFQNIHTWSMTLFLSVLSRATVSLSIHKADRYGKTPRQDIVGKETSLKVGIAP